MRNAHLVLSAAIQELRVTRVSLAELQVSFVRIAQKILTTSGHFS